ncbi:hypothetical protein N9L68_07650 [bacterium]|nr:hypothetical protein [bacterium]
MGTLRIRSSIYFGESLGSAAVPICEAVAAGPRDANRVCCIDVVRPQDISSPTFAPEQLSKSASDEVVSVVQASYQHRSSIVRALLQHHPIMACAQRPARLLRGDVWLISYSFLFCLVTC